MNITRLSLASLFMALLMVGLSRTGHAQLTRQLVQSNCTISQDGKSSLTASISVVQTIPVDPRLPILISGSIILGGHLGAQGFTLNAIPSYVSGYSEAFGSIKVQHVQIISQQFSFLDLNTLTRVQGWISLDLTKGSDGTQMMGFHVFNAGTNSLLVQCWDPARPRVYAQLPLVLGSMFLRL